jgi:hypothetical protein
MNPDLTGIAGAIVRRVPDLPDVLEGAIRVGPYSLARPGALLRVVPSVGRFLARDGNTIEFCVGAEADPAAVAALIQGGVLGALIHQRGELPLHASTLVSPERTFAIALAGPSGAGKSTVAYELTRRGWILLSDDLSRITTAGVPLAWPGRSQLRLMRDACDGFGIDTSELKPAPQWPDKFIARLPRWDSASPLAAVICLERAAVALEIETLAGATAIAMLSEQTYRLHYVAALGQIRRHLELVANVARSVAIVRVKGASTVVELASQIERVIDGDRSP